MPSARHYLSDYSPSPSPYWLEEGNVWLVHTAAGRLYAFAPHSPAYPAAAEEDPCHLTWNEANGRFADPCSGYEWTLQGAVVAQAAAGPLPDRELDQYSIANQDEVLFIQFHTLQPGRPTAEPAFSQSQYGVTMTLKTADFASATSIPAATTISTLVRVDPLWQMDATAFPPQQALTYLTFPDSLIDDQGRSIAPSRRLGGPTVTDPQTGGIQQEMHHYWEAIEADTQVVTATMTVDLSNIHRQISLPLAWDEHQVNDVWPVDIPLEIGHAAVRVRQIEWVRTDANDGLARLRLTVTDESPAGINLYCLHIDAEDPWQRTCANFDGELTYLIATSPGEPVDLHLRAGLSLISPFELVLDVDQTP
jgi:hypothetical protein